MNAQTHPDAAWGPSQAATLKGALLALQRALDAKFLAWADELDAEEYQFPRLIAAAHLDKMDYFRSFPHLATFAVTLGRDPANLAAVDTGAVQSGGGLGLPGLQPVTHVLTPAACYHVYPHFSGARLEGRRVVTTRNTCFRCEAHYEPLRRQWSFEMREVVALGSME
jgi:seryl-tRNA synthetase